MNIPSTDLLVKYMAGTLSRQEHDDLMKWAAQSPKNKAFLDSLDVESFIHGIDEVKSAKEAIWVKVVTEIPGFRFKAKRIRMWPRIAAAAALIVTLAGGYLWYQSSNFNKNEDFASADPVIMPENSPAVLTLADGRKIVLDSATIGLLAKQSSSDIMKGKDGEVVYIATGKSSGTISLNSLQTYHAKQQQIILPDGSRVTMNALSKIEYPTAFIGDNRKVSLSGEAFFQINKDKSKPFIVDLKDASVEVTGTEFNVSAYENQAHIQTTLFEGGVTIKSLNKSTMSIKLAPGQEALVDTLTKQITLVKMADLAQAEAWRKGYFRFKDASIETVMADLQRYYDIDVKFNGTIDQKFNGEIPHSLPLNTVFKVLEASRGVRLKINGRTITVLP